MAHPPFLPVRGERRVHREPCHWSCPVPCSGADAPRYQNMPSRRARNIDSASFLDIPEKRKGSHPAGRVPTQQEGLPPIREEGFPPSREEGFPPSREEGFPPSREEGFPPSREEGFPPSREEGFPPSREEGFTPSREGKGGRGQPGPFCPRSAGMLLIGQNGLAFLARAAPLTTLGRWASLASHNAESVSFSFSRWSDKSLEHSTHIQGIYRNLY